MSDDVKEQFWEVEEWTTISVSVLPPGWVNQYEQDDGSICETPCPALLLQELRKMKNLSKKEGGKLVEWTVEYAPPYQTRVVFADIGPCEDIEPATEANNYSKTIFRPPTTKETEQ